jgi:hypothetical protein
VVLRTDGTMLYLHTAEKMVVFLIQLEKEKPWLAVHGQKEKRWFALANSVSARPEFSDADKMLAGAAAKENFTKLMEMHDEDNLTISRQDPQPEGLELQLLDKLLPQYLAHEAEKKGKKESADTEKAAKLDKTERASSVRDLAVAGMQQKMKKTNNNNTTKASYNANEPLESYFDWGTNGEPDGTRLSVKFSSLSHALMLAPAFGGYKNPSHAEARV